MAKEIKKAKKKSVPTQLPFGKQNLQLMGIGLVFLVVGFILIAQPPVDSFVSLTLAPIVLLIGYLVIIPYAIMYNPKKKEEQ